MTATKAWLILLLVLALWLTLTRGPLRYPDRWECAQRRAGRWRN